MALENMAASFSGLPMGDLIGGPLNAACEAQVRLAMATVDFIKVVGFEAPPATAFIPDPSDSTGNTPLKDAAGKPMLNPWGGRTRTASFKFKRPVQLQPAKPEVLEVKDASGAVTQPKVAAVPAVIGVEDVEIEVPVLAIVKVPALSISTVDVTFDMEVKSSESSKETEDKSGSLEASMSVGWGFFKGSVTVKGAIATHKENTRSSDNSAKYHVEVHARDDGMPEGLARVLDILQQSVAPKAITGAAT